ncbi:MULTISPECIES: hypothetical protein [unclassified Kosmotoga]|nr:MULTISPECIES: hypothetical protein [unclassified Kosmotoga]
MILTIILYAVVVLSNEEISYIPYPMVFVHGFNSEGETWNELAEYLSSKYELAAGCSTPTFETITDNAKHRRYSCSVEATYRTTTNGNAYPNSS